MKQRKPFLSLSLTVPDSEAYIIDGEARVGVGPVRRNLIGEGDRDTNRDE